MNEWKSLFFFSPFILILFWTLTLSFNVIRKKQWFKIPLVLFFIDSLFAVFESGLFYLGKFELFRVMYIPSVFFSLSMFPLFFLYITGLINNAVPSLKTWIKHLAFPLLNVIIAIVVLMLLMTPGERDLLFTETLIYKTNFAGIQKVAFLMDDVFRKIFLLISLFYFWLTNRRVREHKLLLESYFSNSESGEITWFPVFRVSFSLTLLSAFLYFSMQRYSTLDFLLLPEISHALLAVFFWITGYYGQRQTAITLQAPQLQQEKDGPELSKKVFEEIEQRIEKCIHEEKLFLKENLTLPDLASHLGTNRSYLSRYFNEYLNTSYSHFINEKRINYACELIQLETDNTLLTDIYSQSGFNSNASFYRWFKEIKKSSPQHFQQRIKTEAS